MQRRNLNQRHVVILTALRVEHEAVCSHLSNLREEVHPSGTVYQCGSFVANGMSWEVGVAEIGAGGEGAAFETERAIEHFRPRIIFFVGVAGGLKDVVRGDVVAATRVYAYESGKVSTTIEPRPAVWNVAYALEQRARAVARNRDWLQRLSGKSSDLVPHVFVAPIAAGEKVISSTHSQTYAFVRSHYGDAVAIEMEGHGFLQAVRANHHVEALIIRGISDLIDDKASADITGSQEIAAQHASAFVFEILAKLDTSSPGHVKGGSHISLQDRERLIKRVNILWIAGVLEHSLHRATLIALGLQTQPEAIERPWRFIVQELGQPAHPLPAGTCITQVYEDADGELLILGEPGAGKTTLLLELARDLLKQAERDENRPIPVIFNLSSWTTKNSSLDLWLVEELQVKYQVPRKVGRTWVEANQILPLLDGLDEVEEADRSHCIDIINAYRQEHPLPLAICSRRAEYTAQKRLLRLQSAVLIQPLTEDQIVAYLSSIGLPLEGLRAAIQDDSVLQEMVKTPLMLSILTLTYNGQSVGNVSEMHSLETRRRQVFATYTQRMLQRRSVSKYYQLSQTVYWLRWLARQMQVHSQTEFHIERMQMGWLPQKKFYEFFPSVVVGIVLGLFGWLEMGIDYWRHFGPTGALIYGFIGNLFWVPIYVSLNSFFLDGLRNLELRYKLQKMPFRYIRPTDLFSS
jgi:nucleoside phosphorylase/DNA polymerase III delta prime subunit